MEIQNTVKNVLLQTVALSIILIVTGIVILGCSGDSQPVNNAISIYGSYFGGITTLVAAYIASKLYNSWQEAHNKTIEKELIMDLISAYSSLKTNGLRLIVSFETFAECKKQGKESVKKIENILNDIAELDFELNAFSNKYKMYCAFYKKDWRDEISNTISAICMTIIKIDSENSNDAKETYKQRLKDKIIEFHQCFDNEINNSLILKLKADI